MASKKVLSRAATVSVILLLGGCAKQPTSPEEISPPYNVTLPQGKLPWPHHRPDMSQPEYEKLLSDLFVINNFGQYQGDNTKESLYFHDGLDVVLPNGTPIYAVESGHVRAITGSAPYYQSLIIEDKNTPGYAWSYTHVSDFRVKAGDYAPQGKFIAKVNFQGVPHTHLARIFLANGGSWNNYFDLNNIQPDTFFVFKDTQPPVIERPFYFAHNNSDSLFSHGNPTVVSGDVDVVVGIRDQGECAHSKGGAVYQGFGDRLCVNKIEYEISGNGIPAIHRQSFDFSKVVLSYKPGFRDYAKVTTVYMFYHTIHPEGTTSWDKIFSYYAITNTDGSGQFGEINPSHQDYAWNTAAKDGNGNPRFPNGDYLITVRAYDSKGNVATASEIVTVKN